MLLQFIFRNSTYNNYITKNNLYASRVQIKIYNLKYKIYST